MRVLFSSIGRMWHWDGIFSLQSSIPNALVVCSIICNLQAQSDETLIYIHTKFTSKTLTYESVHTSIWERESGQRWNHFADDGKKMYYGRIQFVTRVCVFFFIIYNDWFTQNLHKQHRISKTQFTKTIYTENTQNIYLPHKFPQAIFINTSCILNSVLIKWDTKPQRIANKL